MRKGWDYKKLGEVCTSITDGSHNPPHGIEHSEYRMISSQNIFDDEIRITDDNVRFLTEEDHLKENKRTNLSKDVVLLTIVGTIGRTCVLKGTEGFITLQRSVAALHPSSEINPRYLMHGLIGNRNKLEREAHGIAQRGLYLRQLSNLELPVPSLAEQQSIVSELDKINELISLKKVQLSDLDTLAQSIFYEMFGDPITNEKGWEVKKLGECCQNFDAQRKPITAKDRIKGNIPYYGASGIVDYVEGYIFDGDYLLVSEDGANLVMRSTPIAFCVRGKSWINNHAHVLKFETLFQQKFIEYSINLRDISMIVTGCTQPKLTQATLNNMPVPFPPLSLQQSFARKIEAIEQQKTQITATIKDLETLLASRMQYWFD